MGQSDPVEGVKAVPSSSPSAPEDKRAAKFSYYMRKGEVAKANRSLSQGEPVDLSDPDIVDRVTSAFVTAPTADQPPPPETAGLAVATELVSQVIHGLALKNSCGGVSQWGPRVLQTLAESEELLDILAKI